MRAILVVVVLLAIAIVAAIVGLTVWRDITLQDWRDVVIIAWAVFGILFFLAGIVAALGIFFAVRYLIRVVADAIEDPLKPTLEEALGTVRTVRGGVEFVTDSAVQPVIRAVSFARGVRRGVNAITRRGR